MPTVNAALSAGTYIDAGSPTTNFNDGIPRYIGAVGAENRSIFRFTMPEDPNVGSVITKIELFLYAAERVGAAFNCLAYALRRSDWVQNQATWNIFKTANNWGTAGAKNTTTDIINTIIDQAATPAAGNWYSLVLQGTGADNPLSLNWGYTFDGLLAGDVVTAGRYCGHNPGGGSPELYPYIVVTYDLTASVNTLTNYRPRKRTPGVVSV